MGYISGELSKELLDDIKNQSNGFNKVLGDDKNAFKIKDRKKTGKRGMSTGREGYVRLASRIATQFEEHLSRSDNPAELVDFLRYYEALSMVRGAVMELFEFIDGTRWALGVDCMELVDGYLTTLQGKRKDAAIDAALKEIDDWNKRFGPAADAEDEKEGADEEDEEK